jgi:hypothetical protein
MTAKAGRRHDIPFPFGLFCSARLMRPNIKRPRRRDPPHSQAPAWDALVIEVVIEVLLRALTVGTGMNLLDAPPLQVSIDLLSKPAWAKFVILLRIQT